MGRPKNVLFLVVDSLRADAVEGTPAAAAPFVERLAREALYFSRAYASECWTLPSHVSMFTGLLPSEHGAHFQSMAYLGQRSTIAERLAARGYRTELVTRNPIFDGTIPGVTRGFQHQVRPLARLDGLNPLALLLALSKPRFRRQIETTGFFHAIQRRNRRFAGVLARTMVPADRLALDYVLERLCQYRRSGDRYFIFCNLFDVHAPYSPVSNSMFLPPTTARGLAELLLMPAALAKLGGHRYLRHDFRMSHGSRSLLRLRYDDAVRLMSEKLNDFFGAADGLGLLDDTVVIVASDHGEAFGEHELYFHDASVYETHLRVPLWIRHPERGTGVVGDVVSTRDLFQLLIAIGSDHGHGDTILDPDYRQRNPIALAEHFHYPHVRDAKARYRLDLAAAISTRSKMVCRGQQTAHFDLNRDPGEEGPAEEPLDAFSSACRQQRLFPAATGTALQHLSRHRAEARSAA